MSEENGVIYRISGPVVTAIGIAPRMYEVVRVGNEGLMGEVIELHGDQSVIQVYEETSGVKPGEPVVRTGQTLSVQLGPGLLTQIYDGIQRPLPKLEETMGVFITRGVDADGLDLEKKWDFNAIVKAGDEVSAGQVIGTVQETETIEHRVMVPPGKGGVVKKIESGSFNITQTVCKLEDGTEIAMMQEWPVRHPRPFIHVPVSERALAHAVALAAHPLAIIRLARAGWRGRTDVPAAPVPLASVPIAHVFGARLDAGRRRVDALARIVVAAEIQQ